MGELFMLPLRTVLYGMEILLDAMRGVSRTADRAGVIPAADAQPNAAREEPGFRRSSETTSTPLGITATSTTVDTQRLTTEATAMDKDLSNKDMLKLVRYKILFIKREYEHAFPEQEDLVPDEMDSSAFTAWKVAEFIQTLAKGKTPIPDKWKDYPKPDHRSGNYLIGLDDEDKKYLRVYYEVLDRYPREKFKHEEEQIKVLKDIRTELKATKSAISGR